MSTKCADLDSTFSEPTDNLILSSKFKLLSNVCKTSTKSVDKQRVNQVDILGFSVTCKRTRNTNEHNIMSAGDKWLHAGHTNYKDLS